MDGTVLVHADDIPEQTISLQENTAVESEWPNERRSAPDQLVKYQYKLLSGCTLC